MFAWTSPRRNSGRSRLHRLDHPGQEAREHQVVDRLDRDRQRGQEQPKDEGRHEGAALHDPAEESLGIPEREPDRCRQSAEEAPLLDLFPRQRGGGRKVRRRLPPSRTPSGLRRPRCRIRSPGRIGTLSERNPRFTRIVRRGRWWGRFRFLRLPHSVRALGPGDPSHPDPAVASHPPTDPASHAG